MIASLDLVESFKQFLERTGKKEATIQSYRRDLTQFFEFLTECHMPLASVDQKTLNHYKLFLQAKNDGGKPNSFRRAVIAIRLFYRHLPQFSSLNLSPLDDVPIPMRDERSPRKLRASEVDQLFQSCGQSKFSLKASRDKVILCLLCFEGLKVSELIHLDWKHFLSASSKGSLNVPGERKRLIFLNSQTHEAILEYQKTLLEYESELPRARKMILGFKGRESLSIAPRISRHGLKFMLYEIGEECRIPKLNTEILRHHAIQFHLDRGESVESVMEHFGLRRIGNIAKHFRAKKTDEPKV